MNEPIALQPVIGCWYKDNIGNMFEVVAIDNDDRTIEIQYFDGALEELEMDMWWEINANLVEPPEDWSGSMDVEREDYGIDLGDVPVPDDWMNAVDYMDRFDY